MPEITNPAIGNFGTSANFGDTIAKIIVLAWQTIITIGGIATLLWMLYGGITWLTAGGDKQKLENGRDRIVNAIIGMTILFATVAFVNFIGPAVGLDILKLNFSTSNTLSNNATLPPPANGSPFANQQESQNFLNKLRNNN